ncbi:fumarylacetoacetate hydrolase family protein [Pseudactinotalea sp. HY158]|uniref:fumarylacetoacetate hydrolase family protein n=1 Tax=Pseudactinotalea sp. HY158 TaxID=2654547 RepID=UPI00129C464C|nr:fumarylacetoacetate hydrolase family protein [Pseudactinotalea sp. HY158]QGH68480.1 FAA hydrolase family protein [Pseudactinotalea sp. HY158]
MRFARLGPQGSEIPVLVTEEAHYDLRPITADIDGEFLEHRQGEVAAALAAGTLETIDPAGLRIGAPIARPTAIVCVGMNYAAHAAESGSAPPELPVIFFKHPNTLGGPDDAVEIPRGSEKTDWEVELALVIGKRASYLDSVAEAADHIAGYTVVDDLSERTFQLEVSGGQWSKGKCSPGFSPTGPVLVTADEVDAGNLRLRSWVNGEPRQDSVTADMIFDTRYIVWHLSQFMALEPGDLVITGTPQGVALSGRFPYLSAGDVVEVEIEGIGRQRHAFVEVGSAPMAGGAA